MSSLTSKYQATIPKQVRQTLRLAAGDRVEFLIATDGVVRLRRAPDADPDLKALDALLAPEWDSADDEAAYGNL